MEKGKGDYKAHCLALPYILQSHINPLLQFSKRLQHKGIKITPALTHFTAKTLHGETGSIAVDTVSDGYDEGGSSESESIEAYLTRFKLVGSETLALLIDKLRRLDNPVDFVVYDASLPWALDVVKAFSLVGAPFFTQACAVNHIFYHPYKRCIDLPLLGMNVSIPGLPVLQPTDMPSFIYAFGSYPPILDLAVNQFSNIEKADYVLINTFYGLEKEAVVHMEKLWPLGTIGPTIPSMFLDKQIREDKSYGLSLFEPNNDACITWLNDQARGSVVYVSFGSMAVLNVKEMEELAWGLKNSNTYFLWVVRSWEQYKLPSTFVEDVKEKGLIVSWCPQLEVLAHHAICCFLTHCGWNSTLEALSLGVPMVAMPQWSDQSTNAKFMEDIWKVGLLARPNNEEGIVRREVIEHCIKEVLEGKRGREMKRNSIKWKNLAEEAVSEGGSSDRNIDEFIAKFVLR